MSQFRRPNTNYKEGDEISPSNIRKENVEEYAREVTKTLKFDVGGDPHRLAQSLGGKIHLQDLSDWMVDDKTGSIYVHDSWDFDILLPAYTSPLRDRFTVAHELGHYFLHARQGETPIIAYRKGSGRLEWEANWFAASLLMPAKQFKDEWTRCQDPVHLASVFGVSQDAARIRSKICE